MAAAVFKLATVDQVYASTVFTFPNDPVLTQQDLTSQVVTQPLPSRDVHAVKKDIGVTFPKLITLNGQMNGSSKLTNIRNFARYFYSTGLKRLYFNSSDFVYVYGKRLLVSDSGRRTNFKDYIATFEAPLPMVNSDARFNHTRTVTTASEFTFSNAAFTNNTGTAPAYIWNWELTNTAGNNITKVEIGDESTLSGSNLKIEWTDSTGLASGEVLNIGLLVTLNGILKRTFPTKSGVEFGKIRPATRTAGTYRTMHRLEAAESPTFSFKLTGNSDTASLKAEWHKAQWM